MRVRLFHNSRAGAAAKSEGDVDALVTALREAGVEAEPVALDDGTIGDLVRGAARDGFDAVIAAGGDGTVSAVASALASVGEGAVPLGVLAIGTLNHFAKDLSLPLRPADAARVIALNNPRPVDLGDVNGRCFINNSSIGLYPHMVSKRERHQQRLGYGKWLAMFFAFLSVFRRYPVLEVVLNTGEAAVRRTTPFVFVGNNWYDVAGFNLGGRANVCNGELSLYTANRTGRLGLVRLALRALFGRLEQARDFDAVRLTHFTIDTRKKTLRVAIDGEVTRLAPPLNYRIRPCAIRVLVP
jgi:diacylglycerol kinase family enzyme